MTKFFVDTPIRSSPWFTEKVEVREASLHGLGVFSTELIKKNEIFESAPVIQFDQFTMVHLFDLHGYRHILHDYVFSFNGKAAIALGMGSIYNHSNDNANASHRMNTPVPSIEFVAKRDIQPGEEILIHYWKGKIRGDFTESGTMVGDERITEKVRTKGIARFKKKQRK